MEAGRREAGLSYIHVLSERAGLVSRLAALAADVVLIDLSNPSRDVLEEYFTVSRAVARPVAMFVDQSIPGDIEAAIDAGVSAYVVDGFRKERIKPVLDLAVSRFRSEEHTSELQSLIRSSYAVFCLKKKKIKSIMKILRHYIMKYTS